MENGITFGVAFAAGVLSFFAPCVLPLIPAFVSYLSGVGLQDIGKGTRLKLFLNSVAYVLGFTVVFSILGVLLNGVLGSALAYDARLWINRVGGILIIFFGMFVMGLVKVDFLESDHKIAPLKTKYSYVTSFLFGASFAAGWSPCVGAILGTILTLAATSSGQAFGLLLAYSLGLGVPFLVVGAFASTAILWLKKLGPYLQYYNFAVGFMMIVLGVLVFTGNLAQIANFDFVNSFVLGR